MASVILTVPGPESMRYLAASLADTGKDLPESERTGSIGPRGVVLDVRIMGD